MSAAVKAFPGAARYYASGVNVVMQEVDSTGNLTESRSIIDSCRTHAAAVKKAEMWQRRENKVVERAVRGAIAGAKGVAP